MGRAKSPVILILVFTMLSVGKLGKGHDSYYLNLAAEDYYIGGGEPEGVWLSTAGARSLGLRGKVSKQDLHAFFHGFKPDGTPLVQNAGDPKRTPGHDLTFSSPKSLSVYWAVASQEIRQAIQKAQLDAVTHAIRYLEQEVAISRRGKGGYEKVPAKIVVAAFEHGTSRALDCQLHTHAIVLNIGIRSDGTTGSLESKPFYQHKMVAGAIYRAKLASLLQERLGLKTVRHGPFFEIAGVPKSLCDHFSKRREEIEKALGKQGLETASAAAAATIKTRQAKTVVPPRSELFAQWQETAARFGFTAKHTQKLLHQVEPDNTPQRAAKLVDQAILTTLARYASFDRQTLLRETLQGAVEYGVDPSTIRTAVDGRLQRGTDIITIHDTAHGPRYTTAAALSLQKSITQSVQTMFSPAFRPPSGWAVDSSIDHYSKPRDPLTEELKYHIGQLIRAASRQKTSQIDRACTRRCAKRTVDDTHVASIRDITANRNRIITISHNRADDRHLIAACCREAWQKSGYRVVGVSLSRAGATQLYHETGIEAVSLKRLELMMHPTARYRMRHCLRQLWRAAREKPTYSLDPFKIAKDTILVVDGADQLTFQQMDSLTRDVARQGGRLVLVGDRHAETPDQLHTAFDTICTKIEQLTSGRKAAEMSRGPSREEDGRRFTTDHHTERSL